MIDKNKELSDKIKDCEFEVKTLHTHEGFENDIEFHFKRLSEEEMEASSKIYWDIMDGVDNDIEYSREFRFFTGEKYLVASIIHFGTDIDVSGMSYDDLKNSGIIDALEDDTDFLDVKFDIMRRYSDSHNLYSLFKPLYDRITGILNEFGNVSEDSINNLTASLKEATEKMNELDKKELETAVKDISVKDKGKLS